MTGHAPQKQLKQPFFWARSLSISDQLTSATWTMPGSSFSNAVRASAFEKRKSFSSSTT